MRAALLALACASCAAPTAADGQHRAPLAGGELPCLRDAFGANASQASLGAVYGAGNVSSEVLEDEGGPFVQTQVYGGDRSRRLSIRWSDESALSVPSSVEVSDHGSVWTGPLGLAIGDSIEEIERINGRPFEILGFGWDHGGQLWDTRGGALSRDVRGCRLFVYFAPATEVLDDALIGDRAILSNDPALRAVRPTVSAIVLRYPERR